MARFARQARLGDRCSTVLSPLLATRLPAAPFQRRAARHRDNARSSCAADKNALRTQLKVNMLRIRERELLFFTNNCLSISTSAVPPAHTHPTAPPRSGRLCTGRRAAGATGRFRVVRPDRGALRPRGQRGAHGLRGLTPPTPRHPRPTPTNPPPWISQKQHECPPQAGFIRRGHSTSCCYLL